MPNFARALSVLDRLRYWIVCNLQPFCFLLAYFGTVVLGNLVFATPWGIAGLKLTGLPTTFFQERTTFTFGYWLLLLLPFLLTPLVVLVTRGLLGGLVRAVAAHQPEFGRFDYLIITGGLYAYIAWAFVRADALTLTTGGADAVASVQNRFTLLASLGFFNVLVLQSLLTFLVFYSVVRAIRERDIFWICVAAINVPLISLFLIGLNMKWPVLVFFVGLVIALFVFSRTWPFLKALVGMVTLVGLYLVISTLVFRAAPPSAPRPPAVVASEPGGTAVVASEPGGTAALADRAGNVAGASVRLAPLFLAHALNRMAIPYPYYYNVFTEKGPVCGGVWDQARRGVECRPSWLIYTRMFGQDGFEGKGTAPAAVHISAYALGGWPVAVFALTAASVILGLFSALPLHAGNTVGALAIVGAIAGYHFSQLPGEGPIFYDHGFFWVFLALGVYAVVRAAFSRLFRGRAGKRRWV